MKTLVTIILLFHAFICYSQNPICYTYNAKGERITRSTSCPGILGDDPVDSRNNDETQILSNQIKEGIIFPNPNDGRFTIVLDQIKPNSEFYIYSSLLNLIDRYQIIHNSTEIDISNFVIGNYYIALIEEGKLINQWLIVKSK